MCSFFAPTIDVRASEPGRAPADAPAGYTTVFRITHAPTIDGVPLDVAVTVAWSADGERVPWLLRHDALPGLQTRVGGALRRAVASWLVGELLGERAKLDARLTRDLAVASVGSGATIERACISELAVCAAHVRDCDARCLAALRLGLARHRQALPDPCAGAQTGRPLGRSMTF